MILLVKCLVTPRRVVVHIVSDLADTLIVPRSYHQSRTAINTICAKIVNLLMPMTLKDNLYTKENFTVELYRGTLQNICY